MKLSALIEELTECKVQGRAPIAIRLGDRDWHELAADVMRSGGVVQPCLSEIRISKIAGLVILRWSFDGWWFLELHDLIAECEQREVELKAAESRLNEARANLAAVVGPAAQ